MIIKKVYNIEDFLRGDILLQKKAFYAHFEFITSARGSLFPVEFIITSRATGEALRHNWSDGLPCGMREKGQRQVKENYSITLNSACSLLQDEMALEISKLMKVLEYCHPQLNPSVCA